MAKVLFIDDDMRWQQLLKELLETAGYEIQRAATIDSAINILRGKQKFDVIVFDLKLDDDSPEQDLFIWFDAFIQGMLSRKLPIPPIIILSALEMSKEQIIHAFTEYRSYVYNIFNKRDLASVRKSFMANIKSASDAGFSFQGKPKNFVALLGYTILMSVIVFGVFAVLIWSVSQITSPTTQQTILQVGSALIIVIAIFIIVFSQNTRLQDIAELIQKIWKG